MAIAGFGKHWKAVGGSTIIRMDNYGSKIEWMANDGFRKSYGMMSRKEARSLGAFLIRISKPKRKIR
jgi:hypothetical protein